MSTTKVFKTLKMAALFATIVLLLGMIGLTASWAYASDDDAQNADVAAAADDVAVDPADEVAVQEETPAVEVDKSGAPQAVKNATPSVIESALESIIPDAAFREALAGYLAADDSFTDADFANAASTKAALHRFSPAGLDFSGLGITDVTGVNNLTGVTGSIDFSNNRIKDITPIKLDVSEGYYKCTFNFSENPINRWPNIFTPGDDSTLIYYTQPNVKFESLNSGMFYGAANYLFTGQDVVQNIYYDVTSGGGYYWYDDEYDPGDPHFYDAPAGRVTGNFNADDHAAVTVTSGGAFDYSIAAVTERWAYKNNYREGAQGSRQFLTEDYTWQLTNSFYIPVIQDISTQPVSGILVTKTNASTNEPMAGIEFKLYSDAECTKQVGETQTTDADGVVKWSGLPAGTYYLKETVPDGFAPTGPNPLPINVELDDPEDINNMTGGVDNVTVNHSGDSWIADWDNWYPTAESIDGALVLTSDSSEPEALTSTNSKRYAKVGADNDIAFGIDPTSGPSSSTSDLNWHFTLTMGGQEQEVTSCPAASDLVNAYIKTGNFAAADADGIKFVGVAEEQLPESEFTTVDVSNSPVAYRMKKERVTDAPEAVDPDKTGYGFWAGDTVTYKITVENLCGAVLVMSVSDEFVEDNGSFEDLKYTRVEAATGNIIWLNEDESKGQGTVAPSIQLGPNAVAEVYVTARVADDAEEWLATAEKDHVPARDDMWNYTDPTAAEEAAEEQQTAVDSNDDGYVNVASTSNVWAYQYDETKPDGRGEPMGRLQDDDDYANTPVQVPTPSYTMEKFRESLAPIKQSTEEGYGFYVGNTVTYVAVVTNTGGMDLVLDVSDVFDEGNFSTPKVQDVEFGPASGFVPLDDPPEYGRIISGKGTDCVKIELKVDGQALVYFTAEVKDNPEYLAPDESDFRGSDKVSTDGYQNTVTTSDVVATLEFKDSSTGETRTITMTKEDTDALDDMTDTADTPVQIPEPDYIMSKCRVTDAPEKESDPDHYGFFKGDEVTYEVTVTNTGDMDLTMNVSDKFNEGSFSTPKVTGVKFYETDGMVESDDFGSVTSALGKDNVNIELKIGGTAVVTYTANVRQNREYLAPTTDDKKDNPKDGYLNTATTSNVVASVTYIDPNTEEEVTFTQKLEKKTDTANTPVQKTEEMALTGDSSTLLFTGGLLVGFALLFLAISRTTGNSFAGATSFMDGVAAKPSRNRAKQAPIEAVSRSTHERSSRKGRR